MVQSWRAIKWVRTAIKGVEMVDYKSYKAKITNRQQARCQGKQRLIKLKCKHKKITLDYCLPVAAKPLQTNSLANNYSSLKTVTRIWF